MFETKIKITKKVYACFKIPVRKDSKLQRIPGTSSLSHLKVCLHPASSRQKTFSLLICKGSSQVADVEQRNSRSVRWPSQSLSWLLLIFQSGSIAGDLMEIAMFKQKMNSILHRGKINITNLTSTLCYQSKQLK